MGSVLDRMRGSDWRVTPQRRVIAEVFDGANLHLTADEVLVRAQAELPEVSQTTVHDTLSQMVDRGFLRELVTADRRRRFDPNIDRHQHLLCRGCGALRDVYPEGTDGLRLRSADQGDFTLEQVEVVFVGLCAQCADEP